MLDDGARSFAPLRMTATALFFHSPNKNRDAPTGASLAISLRKPTHVELVDER
jgi:hypothetical protein